MKLTFPHMGNAFIPVKAMLDYFGVDFVVPPFNSRDSLEIGTRYAPEGACLPLKMNIGNLVLARDAGADTVLMVGGCGPCRFGYYCEMEREILADAGIEMEFITLDWYGVGFIELTKRILHFTGTLNPVKLFEAIRDAVRIASSVDELERRCCESRVFEISKGATDRLYNDFRNKAAVIKSCKGIKKLIHDTLDAIDRIDTVSDCSDTDYRRHGYPDPVRVGIVGEIYTSIDSFTGFELAERLGRMGIIADRKLTVSGWISEHIVKNILPIPKNMDFKRAAEPYLKAMIGGHARETLGNTALYADKGFDGVIQVFPLTCMPEIVAESILPSVSRDKGIPVLTLIIDEMTGEAGYQTRLEAFADLLHMRRKKREGTVDSNATIG